jgi:menaquinone reductase, multiheme cytochrome c subunit
MLLADDRLKNPGAVGGIENGSDDSPGRRFVFPRWSNLMGPVTLFVAGGGMVYLVVLIALIFHPQTSAIGYAPAQPVPFSHALHTGELGLDCRYCHNTVEHAAHASIPPTETCMNCHATIHTESARLFPVRQSQTTAMAIPWIKVHDLPDYAVFDHRAHVGAGVGCASCHGRIDRMDIVSQQEALTMSWCLNCHRRPDADLRPLESITSMRWAPDEDPVLLGRRLRAERNIEPSTDCTTCHR